MKVTNLPNIPSKIAWNCRRTPTLPWRKSLLAVAVFAGFSLITSAQAQTDNFDSGALVPNWATSISANYPGFITFPADPFGGKAIRLVSTNCTLLNPSSGDQDSARVIMWRTDRLYTNFYVAVDLLSWNTSIDRDTNGPMVCLFGRMINVLRNPSIPVGRPDTMVLYLNVNRFGGVGGGTRGQLVLGHLTDGQAHTPLDTVGVISDFTLNPGRTYRMTMTGTNLYDGSGTVVTNSIFWGRIYDLQDLTRPLATVRCPDPYPGYGGFFGNPVWEAPGYSGFGSVASGTNKTTDITFDNFVAAEYPPASVSLPGTTNGQAGVAQVINRTPASYSNFYAPAGGIQFTATTLGAGNVTSVKLFLNGVDVSSSLVLGPVSNSRAAALPGSFLSANMVYDARIELANAAGQTTTNAWTFDTFSDAYLASALCKDIECEDFDFNGGQFIDNPVPSGWPTNTTYYNNFNTVAWAWPNATNQDLGGPPYTSYVNKGTPSDLNVDYWDNEGHSGNQVWYTDLRPLAQPTGGGQSPGTCQGDPSYVVVEYAGWFFPGYTGQNEMYTYDTQRQKYIDVDPVNRGIQEYMLSELEGGEWYNYTRTFNGANYYNVYLRNASEYTEQLRLDRVSPGPTTKLGEFYTTNALVKCNWRYAPLLDASGKPAVVNLSGVSTIRLTVDVLQEERTKRGLMLNYLVFVPALVVQTSAQASTGYTVDYTATVEPVSRQITIPQTSAPRYYRLMWPGNSVRITSITLTGGNVVLTYQ
jgi:hypothetical protein